MTHKELRDWLRRNSYTQARLAKEIGASTFTVKSWTLPPTSKSSRPIPGPIVRILELLEGKR